MSRNVPGMTIGMEFDEEKQNEIKARQGVRYPNLEGAAIMDPETMKEVPKDGKTIGEIMLRGNVVMKGYFKDKDATDKAMAGGWFHSGDLAVMHPDGYVKIQDRSKDIIISGGENISSIEIENTLSPNIPQYQLLLWLPNLMKSGEKFLVLLLKWLKINLLQRKN